MEEQYSLRRIPMGNTLNGFELLKQLTNNETKLYCVIQQESLYGGDNQCRYFYKQDMNMNRLYRLAHISKPTGIKCLQSLVDKGFLKTYKHNVDGEIKDIYTITKPGTFYVLCNLDIDLYNILNDSKDNVCCKLYLYHCFKGEAHAQHGYKYSYTLDQIMHDIGHKKVHDVISANKLLHRLGVINMDKYFNEKNMKTLITYTYNSQYKRKWEEYKAKRRQGIDVNWNPYD